jgi:hypothetical protein
MALVFHPFCDRRIGIRPVAVLLAQTKNNLDLVDWTNTINYFT